MRAAKGDLASVRNQNRRLVLSHLRRFGPTGRAQLAEDTQLSRATLTLLTAELLGEGLLIEREGQLTGVGRRPVPLEINYGAHFAVGVKVMKGELRAVLTDLATNVLARAGRPIAPMTPARAAEVIASVVDDLLAEAGVDPARLLGVGVGLSGLVDADRGVALHVPEFGWFGEPFAELVETQVRVPVHADNVVNTFAAAEALFGRGQDWGCFVAVTNGRGIGAGIVVEGEIHRGRRGGAGEFGHTLSEPGGRVCGCGRRGCLEAYASETALLARYAETRPDGALPDIDTFLARADAGDGLALELLRDAGERTGRNLGDLVNLLAPEGIVFGGEGVRLGERFFAPLREALESRAYPGLADDLPVLIDAWDDDAWARGAASLVVHEAFSAARLTPAVEAVKGPL